MMDQRRARLRFACAMFVRHKSPGRIATALRQEHSRATGWLDTLTDDEREAVDLQVDQLSERGIDACWQGSDAYPQSLSTAKNAPPILFMQGNTSLFNSVSVGMCGSRDASESSLKAAHMCGAQVARHGMNVVSGYAKGVDTQTHLAALETGGCTVIVLAEGILGFRTKRVFKEVGLDWERVLVLSQFAPNQGWSVGAAMTRNGVICGLGKALVVVQAGEKGGTLNAGLQALDMGKPVLALQFTNEATPPGNEILMSRGARPVRNTNELSAALDSISDGPAQAELFTQASTASSGKTVTVKADIDLTAEFDAHVAPFRDALRHLVQVERNVRQSRGLLATAESDAMAEIANGQRLTGGGAWGDDVVQRAYSTVSVLLMAAEDHILAVCRLFDPGPSPVYAHMALARVPFEACLTARWLLEDGGRGNARSRIARFMNYRLDDLNEKAKAMELVDESERRRGPYPKGRPRADIVREDAASILDEAQRLGFEIHTNKVGTKPLCLKPELPPTIALAEQFMGYDDSGQPSAGNAGILLWRYWSGITHSKWYALREGVEAADDVIGMVPGTVPANFVTRSLDILSAFSIAAITYLPACGRFHTLMGWEEPERLEAAEAVLAHVRARFATPSAAHA